MGQALWSTPITINQNEDTSLVTVWANAATGLQSQLTDATPFTWSGAAGYLQIATELGGTNLLTLTGTASVPGSLAFGGPTNVPSGAGNVSCGTITITITNAQALALPTGVLYYDLLVVMTSSNQYYMSGPFTVLGTAARI